MSTASSVSSSSTADYATQLAASSSLTRSLYNLGSAVRRGDLTSAGSILKAIVKAHPEYASSSTSSTASSTSSTSSSSNTTSTGINADFSALSTAIDSKDTSAARKAWSQLKTDLASEGLTNLSDGTLATAKLLAENKASQTESLLSALFGNSSGSSSSISSLLGFDSTSDTTDSVNSIVNKWLTYKQDSSTASTTASDTTGSTLDTKA